MGGNSDCGRCGTLRPACVRRVLVERHVALTLTLPAAELAWAKERVRPSAAPAGLHRFSHTHRSRKKLNTLFFI
jgi:hypothetical protein